MGSKVTKSNGHKQIKLYKKRKPGNITLAGLQRKLKTKLNYYVYKTRVIVKGLIVSQKIIL